MATRRMSIFGALQPDTSGNVWFEPSSIALTNDRFPALVLRFKDTATKLKAFGDFSVPKDFVSAPKLVAIWGSSATAGNCVWDAEYKAIAAGESLDPSTDDETATVTTAVGASAWLQRSSSLTLTAANFAIDDLVEFSFGRDGTDAADTLAADALLFDLLFEYSDV